MDAELNTLKNNEHLILQCSFRFFIFISILNLIIQCIDSSCLKCKSTGNITILSWENLGKVKELGTYAI
jgi:hypothetical protein